VKATIYQLPHLLHQLYALIAERSDNAFFAALEKSGLTPSQLKALKLLSQQKEPISLSKLGTLMKFSLPTTSRIAERLVSDGYVLRMVNEKDRRGRLLSLSSDGAALLHTIHQARLHDLQTFVDDLPPHMADDFASSLAVFLKDLS
jgi:MarR family transcriptional regulator, transcriptional regulator for hemolysin